MNKTIKVSVLILLVLLIDQALKFYIKTNFEYGQEYQLLGLDWALLHFVENKGMAFGIELGGDYGKLALSLFRILAVSFLVYYLRMLIRSEASFGLVACFGLILAGAIGNILDSAFYGVIFSETPYHGGVATLFPEGGGYSSFLHGKVVDMFYFPIWEGIFPQWLPGWGGEHFLFFRPVFNIADAAITVGVVTLLLFYRSFFSGHEEGDPTGASKEIVASSNLDDKSIHSEGLETKPDNPAM